MMMMVCARRRRIRTSQRGGYALRRRTGISNKARERQMRARARWPPVKHFMLVASQLPEQFNGLSRLVTTGMKNRPVRAELIDRTP